MRRSRKESSAARRGLGVEERREEEQEGEQRARRPGGRATAAHGAADGLLAAGISGGGRGRGIGAGAGVGRGSAEVGASAGQGEEGAVQTDEGAAQLRAVLLRMWSGRVQKEKMVETVEHGVHFFFDQSEERKPMSTDGVFV